MSVAAMIGHLLLERLSRRILPRVPETDAVMAAPAQVDAFMASGRGAGMLAHLYFFNAVMSVPVIRAGDVVLDLACGPANQLAQIARLHPRSQFIGIDASPAMLALARATLADIPNAQVQPGDITQLSSLESASIDCVLCTMSLHHLPDSAALEHAMREIRRVLKPEGGVYLADFGRLKRTATQRYFAHDRADEQSPQFTEDFLLSLRAAFSIDELRAATAALAAPLSRHATALAPFLMIFRSAARGAIDDGLVARVEESYRRLSDLQRRDVDNLVRWFRLGGLALPAGINLADGESRQRRAGRRSATSMDRSPARTTAMTPSAETVLRELQQSAAEGQRNA